MYLFRSISFFGSQVGLAFFSGSEWHKIACKYYNTSVTLKNDFLVIREAICSWAWLRHWRKWLANRPTRDQDIAIHDNSCIIISYLNWPTNEHYELVKLLYLNLYSACIYWAVTKRNVFLHLFISKKPFSGHVDLDLCPHLSSLD